MKLSNLFLAVVAATETTVASVETTAAATVAATAAATFADESTAADVAESTDAVVAESTDADVEDDNIDDPEDDEDDQEDGEDDQEDGEDDHDDDHDDDHHDDEEKTDCAEVKAFIVSAKQGLEEQRLAEMSEDPEIGTDVWKFIDDFCTEICVAEGQNCDDIYRTACTESQSALKAANETETIAMKAACDSACADFEEETCESSSTNACDEARGAFEAAANESEKTALKTACDLACADVEGATCGFLVNGVSFVLFAILAVFKY